jgi:hypothetical protein
MQWCANNHATLSFKQTEFAGERMPELYIYSTADLPAGRVQYHVAVAPDVLEDARSFETWIGEAVQKFAALQEKRDGFGVSRFRALPEGGAD